MAKIFLFRHGQTDYNVKGIFCGWMDDAELTEDGINECKGIAEKLKDVKPTKAYTSDLKRAQRTLQIVLGGRKDVVVIIEPRLRERNYGELTGKSKTETAKNYPDEYPLWHRSYDVAPPGGECMRDVEKRVLLFLNEMLPTLKKDDVVFISAHGNSLRPIRRYFEKMSTEEMCSFEHALGKVYEYDI
ncbi:MAG: histidine phosphatase family protein [Candidatus Micrarchaeaceae archaeon]|jgi:2,3-bisphosphoglycerate-dependent phosphoglycerate mutase